MFDSSSKKMMKDDAIKQDWIDYSNWVTSKLRQMKLKNETDNSRFIDQNETMMDMISDLNNKVKEIFEKLASNKLDIIQLNNLIMYQEKGIQIYESNISKSIPNFNLSIDGNIIIFKNDVMKLFDKDYVKLLGYSDFSEFVVEAVRRHVLYLQQSL